MTKGITSKKTTKKRNREDNLIPGFKNGQPTPEQKKAGWDRKREAKRMMDRLLEFGEMTIDELNEYVENNKKTTKIKDQLLLAHVNDILKDKKTRLDGLNRHISYAPNKQEVDQTNLNLDKDITKMDDDELATVLQDGSLYQVYFCDGEYCPDDIFKLINPENYTILLSTF